MPHPCGQHTPKSPIMRAGSGGAGPIGCRFSTERQEARVAGDLGGGLACRQHSSQVSLSSSSRQARSRRGKLKGLPARIRRRKLKVLPGDPNPQYFSKSTAVQMGGVLPYKWGAYCRTNGRRIAGFPFLRSLEARKVRRYKWGAYCRTNGRSTAVLFRQVVRVGVSETLPISEDEDEKARAGKKMKKKNSKKRARSACVHLDISVCHDDNTQLSYLQGCAP